MQRREAAGLRRRTLSRTPGWPVPSPSSTGSSAASGPIEHLPKVPSLALRLARVADGSIDVGLVSANAQDWDIAAADLILHEAGGLLTDLDGSTPVYNRPVPSTVR